MFRFSSNWVTFLWKTKVNRKTKLRRCKYLSHFNKVWALSSMWNTTGPLFCQRGVFFRPIAMNICCAWFLLAYTEKTVTFNSNSSPADRIYCFHFETAGAAMRNLEEAKCCLMPQNWEVNKEPRTHWLVMYSVLLSSWRLTHRHAHFAYCHSYYLPCLTMLYRLYLL